MTEILFARLNSSGLLPVTLGGTGITSYTVGDLIYASAVDTLSKLAAVSAGSALVSTGVGAAPAWSATKLLWEAAALSPLTNDTVSLGKSGTAFSDVFLASGGLIDFGAGNVVLSHFGTQLLLSGSGLNLSSNASPTLSFGTSGNVEAFYTTLGSGSHTFRSATGSTLFQISPNGSASIVNYLQLVGNIAANPPYFAAQGADANIGITFIAKGAGTIQLQTSGSGGINFYCGAVIGTVTASALTINATTATTSTTTGAIVAAGGIASGNAIACLQTAGYYLGSSRFAYSNTGIWTINDSGGTGVIQLQAGGVDTAYFTDTVFIFRSKALAEFCTINATKLNVAQTTASTSSTTGALTVAGGLGVGGSIWVAAAQTFGIGTTVAIRYNVAGGGSANWYFGNSGNASASHTGSNNVAVGTSAMTQITGAANSNVAIGSSANNNMTTGAGNMAIGNAAIFFNLTGSNNVGVGTSALSGASGVSISNNVGIGSSTLFNVQADNNTAIGANAGQPVSTGASNVFIGVFTGRYNSAAALDTAITGSFNIIIGPFAQIPSATTNAQLNIGGLILGTGLSTSTTGALATASSANINIIGSLKLDAYFARTAPVTEAGTTHTVATTTSYLICNNAGIVTVTLPAAASFVGREIYIKNIDGTATVVSASSNVIPRVGGAAGTAILAAADGAWALLVSNGTNWEIMAGS